LDQKRFRAYFKEPVTQNHERWDRFLNNLEEHHIRELLMTMEIFRDEVNQVLITTDISDIETSEFFKRLSAAIYSHRNATAEYDPVKQFSGFLWTVLSGWDIISGYRERDVVQDMIDAI
jgi:hypothetical protein